MILTEREHRVLQALAARLFPRDPRFPESGAEIDFAAPVERYLAPVHSSVTANLKRAIVAFERGAHLSRWSLRPFTGLSPEEQDRYIQAWQESRFYPRRAVFNALKIMLSMIYASRASVERAAGYSTPTGPT